VHFTIRITAPIGIIRAVGYAIVFPPHLSHESSAAVASLVHIHPAIVNSIAATSNIKIPTTA